jgi:hypothetical protein
MTRITQKFIDDAVRKATILAYNDGPGSNLDFLAMLPVSVDTAVKIMTEALNIRHETDKGYNDFQPAFLRRLPADSKIWLAREYSVCIYVKGNVAPNMLYANEHNFYEKHNKLSNVTRFWWD